MQSTVKRTAAFDDYLENIPNLHTWDNGKTWNTGGFERTHLAAFHDLVRSQDVRPRVLETGAGNSTLCFLHAEPERLVSIAPDAELFERIDSYARAKGLATTPLEPHVERSELVLPRLVFEERDLGRPFHFALIDGGHGWPTVFVDFCYVNALLARNGLLAIDDIQLHSVKELARFLSADPHYPLVADLGKALVFRKTIDLTFLPDHGYQPYIVERTRADEAARETFSLERTLEAAKASEPDPSVDERLRAMERRLSRLEAKLAEVAAAATAPPADSAGEETLPAALVLAADMYLPPGTGFHDLEFDGGGRPYRWTGPGTDFFLAGTLDRSMPCELRLDILFADPAVPPEATRCFVDGVELSLDTRRPEWGGWQLVATVPRRAAPGETTFHFATAGTFAPPTDTRRLGIAFARFACGPAAFDPVELAGSEVP
jgi:hypothetical protein